MYRAKVWLIKDKMAIGSWNFFKAATWVGIKSFEKNTEAGIICDSNDIVFNTLSKDLGKFHKSELVGSTEEELEKRMGTCTYIWDTVNTSFLSRRK